MRLRMAEPRRNPLKTGLGTARMNSYSSYHSTAYSGRNPLKTGLGTARQRH